MIRTTVTALLSSAVVVGGAGWLVQSDEQICLEVVAETASSITLSWVPPSGADGYRFWKGGKVVSHTWDGSRASVKFGRPGPWRVDVLDVVDSASYPPESG